ncbi:hypothetical protein [Flavobacterium enshiense]|uniref:hypothetical protein n=1 Tax=Flavobacterium enshiense TaxID=1341165 RepID=UPI001FCA6C4B|nr:hypothetical protein [Flavobacterium enshiense]UOK43407.1 hypothetical protein LZF87_04620 [Flavobacterium enshiense]
MKNNVIFDFIIPFVVTFILSILLNNNLLRFDNDFVINTITVLGILAGFSVTAITILTTTNNETTIKLKEKKTGIIVDGLEVSFFRKLYILISYSILICLITIILNTIGYLIHWRYFFNSNTVLILKAMDIFLILHIFFVNIRNITSLYFLYFDETNLKGN